MLHSPPLGPPFGDSCSFVVPESSVRDGDDDDDAPTTLAVMGVVGGVGREGRTVVGKEEGGGGGGGGGATKANAADGRNATAAETRTVDFMMIFLVFILGVVSFSMLSFVFERPAPPPTNPILPLSKKKEIDPPAKYVQ